MPTNDLVMVIDKPTFQVKLHSNLLEVDLKKGAKKELEDALEANPKLRGSVGLLFQTMVPLDIPLKDIEKAELDKKNQVKIKIPHRRDITIPLDPKESKKLVDKLNELVPVEKQKETERLMATREARKELLREGVETRKTEARMAGRERE
jgi:hypothetical protein